jgi:hypothetical protein
MHNESNVPGASSITLGVEMSSLQRSQEGIPHAEPLRHDSVDILGVEDAVGDKAPALVYYRVPDDDAQVDIEGYIR